MALATYLRWAAPRLSWDGVIDIEGLRAALATACPDSEIETLDWPRSIVGTARRDDRAVAVHWLRDRSVFEVRFRWRNRFMNRVIRTDLADATGSAATWLGGATPREFATAWPFADFVGVANALESGDRIEYAWQTYRVDPRHHRGFIEAAMREPRLREMFPFTSMWWMSFRPTADEFRVPGPWVRAAGDGRFTVVVDRRVEPVIDYDAAEAVQVCVAEMDRLGVVRPPSEHRPPTECGG
jgi:hypothetical protein